MNTDTKREEWREKMYEWCERNCKPGEFHFGSLIQIVYDELTTLRKEEEEAVENERWRCIHEMSKFLQEDPELRDSLDINMLQAQQALTPPGTK